jgi:single-stranded DNA-binding protein
VIPAVQLTEITVLVNQRWRNGDGECVEVPPTRHSGQVFKSLAESVAESLARGYRVFVHATVATGAGTDRQSGGKRSGSSSRPCSLVANGRVSESASPT